MTVSELITDLQVSNENNGVLIENTDKPFEEEYQSLSSIEWDEGGHVINIRTKKGTQDNITVKEVIAQLTSFLM